MTNLFSRTEIYEMKKSINNQKNNYINRKNFDKNKLQSLSNFYDYLSNMERKSSKTTKILK